MMMMTMMMRMVILRFGVNWISNAKYAFIVDFDLLMELVNNKKNRIFSDLPFSNT